MAAYKLYGNEMSFYTGKVRAYLDWKGLSYEEILPSREIFKTVLLPNVGRPVVPVLQTPEGDFIQDSNHDTHFPRQHPMARCKNSSLCY